MTQPKRHDLIWRMKKEKGGDQNNERYEFPLKSSPMMASTGAGALYAQ